MFVVGGRAFNMKRVEMFIGESFCQALEFLDVFGIIHSAVAGMVLAIIRLLYIKYPHKLNKFRNGRFEGGLLMCGGTYIASFTLTFITKVLPSKAYPTTLSLCLGRSQEFQKIMFNYSSDGSIMYKWQIITSFIYVIMIFCWSLESIIYIMLFKFMLHHESSLKSKESVALKKLKQNVITLKGQAITFMVQALFWACAFLVYYGITPDPSIVWMGFICDASISAIQIVYSPKLRAETIAMVNSFKAFLPISPR